MSDGVPSGACMRTAPEIVTSTCIVPAGELSSAMSNSPKKLERDLRRRIASGWPNLFGDGYDAPIRGLWDALARLLVTGVGHLHGNWRLMPGVVPIAAKQQNPLADEDTAFPIFTMWLLEETHHHPWKVVRVFVRSVLGPPVPFPHMIQAFFGAGLHSLVFELRSRLHSARLVGHRLVLLCTQCGHAKTDAVDLRACSCGMVRYCSRTCQKNHWSTHKYSCLTGPGTTQSDWTAYA